MQRIRLSQTRLLRAEIVRKENRLYNTVSIILRITGLYPGVSGLRYSIYQDLIVTQQIL